MKMKEITNFILERNLEIKIKENEVTLVNYKNIGHFESKKIIINCELKKVIIKGESLIIKKLLSDEILIKGVIKNIELGDL